MTVVSLPGLLGTSEGMRRVSEQTRVAAPTRLPVVIVGETGTGKELVARALHALGPNPGGPWIPVNCAAIPEGLAEAELFGAERGAFTGAIARRRGLVCAARLGTLFLDEGCSLSPGVQAKLLRGIEYGEFFRVGGTDPVRADTRVVVAVARPVGELVRSEVWRDDFAQRVAGIEIHLPPLRARLTDLPLLAGHFLRSLEPSRERTLTAEAIAALQRYPWPGNVRELRMVMERLAVLCSADPIEAEHILGVLPVTPELVRSDLEAGVARAGGSLREASRILGIPRTTLRRRLRGLGLLP